MGCNPCGPPVTVLGVEPWHEAHAASVPAWPCRVVFCTLSLTTGVGDSACVEPWQASHCKPPWPLEKRYKERPAPGVSTLVAKVWSAATRTVVPLVNTEV